MCIGGKAIYLFEIYPVYIVVIHNGTSVEKVLRITTPVAGASMKLIVRNPYNDKVYTNLRHTSYKYSTHSFDINF